MQIWQVGNDLSQFIGPIILNHLLQVSSLLFFFFFYFMFDIYLLKQSVDGLCLDHGSFKVHLFLVLQSMQRGDPTWIGFVYAFAIFVGVVCLLISTFEKHIMFICSIF